MRTDPEKQQSLDSHRGDVSAGDRRLRSSLEIVFRDVQLQPHDARASEQHELRTALRQICVDARHAGLRAEQLLVMIKDVWSTLPAGLSRIPSLHGDERLSLVISTCVDEYYGDVDAGDQPSGGRESSR